MRTRYYIYILLAGLSLAMWSCEGTPADDTNGGGVVTPPNPGGGSEETTYLTFGSDDDFAWGADMQIGLFSDGGEVVGRNWLYVNKSAAKEPSFVHADDSRAFDNTFTGKSFVAYYPYSASIDGGAYRVDVSNQSSIVGGALRVAKCDMPLDGDGNEAVILPFEAPFSNVTINLVAGVNMEQSDFERASLSVKGVLSAADFDMELYEYDFTGKFLMNGAKIESDSASSSCSLVVLPQTLAGKKITFTYDITDKGEYYMSLPDTITEFKSGMKYEFNAVFDNQTVRITSANISEWVVADTIVDSVFDTEEADAMIYPKQRYANVISHVGFDTKDGNAQLTNYANAEEVYINQDFDLIRISMVPGYTYNDGRVDTTTGHPEPGVVQPNVYSKFLLAAQNAVKARGGNDNVVVFASKKVHWGTDGGYMLPVWVQTAPKTIVPDKYAILIYDFIRYFKDNGVEIDVLGIDNEGIGGNAVTAPVFVSTYQNLKAILDTTDLKMPQMIGKDAWGPSGGSATWLSSVLKADPTALDIYGVHYYLSENHPKDYGALLKEINIMSPRPFWATEPHWNRSPADIFYHSMDAISCLWAQIDAGMSTFIWWQYGGISTTSLRNKLMNALTVPMRGAQLIRMDDHDGEEDVYKFLVGNLMTRAFVEDNQVTVYAMNVIPYDDRATGTYYKDYKFSVGDDYVIDGDVTYSQWCGVESDALGFTERLNLRKLLSEGQSFFRLDMPVRSITRMQFKIKER